MFEMINKKMVVVIVAVVIAAIAIAVISNLTGRNVVIDLYKAYKTYYYNLADCDKETIKGSVKDVVKMF